MTLTLNAGACQRYKLTILITQTAHQQLSARAANWWFWSPKHFPTAVCQGCKLMILSTQITYQQVSASATNRLDSEDPNISPTGVCQCYKLTELWAPKQLTNRCLSVLICTNWLDSEDPNSSPTGVCQCYKLTELWAPKQLTSRCLPVLQTDSVVTRFWAPKQLTNSCLPVPQTDRILRTQTAHKQVSASATNWLNSEHPNSSPAGVCQC